MRGELTVPDCRETHIPVYSDGSDESENESMQTDQDLRNQTLVQAGQAQPDHPRELGPRTKFVTPPNGNMRDVLTVECPKIYGPIFNGSITIVEAKNEIFIKTLGLSPDLLHTVQMSFA